MITQSIQLRTLKWKTIKFLWRCLKQAPRIPYMYIALPRSPQNKPGAIFSPEYHRAISTLLRSRIHPPLVFGPWLAGYSRPNESSILLKKLAQGGMVPSGGMGMIDVRDVARAHVLAMEKSNAKLPLLGFCRNFLLE